MQMTSDSVKGGLVSQMETSDEQQKINDVYEESILITNINHNNSNNSNNCNNISDNNSDKINNKLVDKPIEITIINIDDNKRNSPISDKSSHNISIVSLDDDIDSSIASDSDIEIDDLPTTSSTINNYCIDDDDDDNNQHIQGNNGMIVLSQNLQNDLTNHNNHTNPNIGSIAVQNSTDITFGNKTFYQGPVTIKQFLLDNNKWRPNGQENQAFQNSNGSFNLGNQSNETKNDEIPQNKFVTKKPFLLIAFSTFFVAILLVSGTLIYTLGKADIKPVTRLRLISRREWIAQPPNEPLNKLQLPVGRIIIAHTVTENCTTQASCTFQVRTIQTYHIESRGWDDIGYNFLVGGDGAVYEGRGWDKEGAHTKGYNRGSICIAFIGTFTKYEPPQRQLDATQLLLTEGVRLGFIKDDYKLYGHRQFMATESPGQKLYDLLTKWQHFSTNIEESE